MFALIVIPLGVVSFITAISFLVQGNVSISIYLIFLSICFLWFGVITSSFELRKYAITPEGLYLRKIPKKLYTWDQICEIGVFFFDGGVVQPVFDKVICCFLHPPTKDIEKILFRNCFFAVGNQKKFVVIDYDDETMRRLCSVYPKEIHDYTAGRTGHIRNWEGSRLRFDSKKRGRNSDHSRKEE